MKIIDLFEENIYDILEPEDCGPFDGGCVLVAQALQKIHGGDIVVLVNDRGNADHAAVKIGNTLLDFDGPLPVDKFVKRFEKNEHVKITGIRPMVAGDLPDATRNQSLLPKIINLLSKGKSKNVKETSVKKIQEDGRHTAAEWYADGAYGKRGKKVVESLNVLSQWKNDEPVGYVKQLVKFFKNPDELTHKRAIWYNKDGFKRIEVLDEYILHSSPLPHYDYVYSYVDLKVPHDLSDDLAKSSESILIDHLKGEVGARCASLSANAVTLQYVMDVVEGNIKPSKAEYEKRIKSMKKMFADGKRFELDWWPDVTGDTDPKNPYYKESKSNNKNPVYEDGRIVKGVNTTVDVSPNEIKTQSAKFGNRVDNNGFPPFLRTDGKIKEEKYTAAEWAIISGGHSLEVPTEKPKLFNWNKY